MRPLYESVKKEKNEADKMSENEIIERVNKFINITVLYGKTYGMTCDDLKKYQQIFRGLLDLYNKEKEKNKELLKLYNQKLNADWKDAISKDKIRAKIEWLKQISDNGINAVRFAATYEDEIERIERQKNISTMINILEELKEEN